MLVTIPEEVAEWIEISKEMAAYYTAAGLEALGFPDEIKKKAVENDKKHGINIISIYKALGEYADCGIGQWMEDKANSFAIISKAMIDGYEINGTLDAGYEMLDD